MRAVRKLEEPTLATKVQDNIVLHARLISSMESVGAPEAWTAEEWATSLSHFATDLKVGRGVKRKAVVRTPALYLALRGEHRSLAAAITHEAARTGAGSALSLQRSAADAQFAAATAEARAVDYLVSTFGIHYLFSAGGRLQLDHVELGLTLAIAHSSGDDIVGIVSREAEDRREVDGVGDDARRRVARAERRLRLHGGGGGKVVPPAPPSVTVGVSAVGDGHSDTRRRRDRRKDARARLKADAGAAGGATGRS